MAFTEEQRQALKHRHVKTRGNNGTPISYLEGWHAIAEANRIFGYSLRVAAVRQACRGSPCRRAACGGKRSAARPPAYRARGIGTGVGKSWVLRRGHATDSSISNGAQPDGPETPAQLLIPKEKRIRDKAHLASLPRSLALSAGASPRRRTTSASLSRAR
jgi:hypothetical protein